MPIHSTEDDTFVLIGIAKDGDEQALNTLFARYQKKVLRIVRLRLNPGMREKLRLQSMDILQEVFLHALKNLVGFQPTSEASFIHWLSRIVENVIRDRLDFVSTQKRASSGEDSLDKTITASGGKLRFGDFIALDGTSPTQYVLRRDIQTLVDDLLLELDERDREVIIQHKLEGLTFREIALDSGKSEDAVRKRFNRSFCRLVSLAENNNALKELRF